MNRKLLAVCLIAGLSVSLNACSEGDYNELNCNASTYQSECLDSNHLMECLDGKLTVTACQSGYYCEVATPKVNPDGTIDMGGSRCTATTNETINKEATCTHTSPICLDAVQQEVCVGGVAQIYQCANGCEAGACKTTPSDNPTVVCTEGAQKCENNTAYVCSNNSWGTGTPCPNGCNGSVCNSSNPNDPTVVCADGAQKCESDIAYVCSNNSWGTGTPCSNGCDGNVCAADKPTPQTCTGDEVKCNGNELQACQGGVLVSQNCEFGCVNGACREYTPTNGKQDDECDAFTYVETCNGQIGDFCDEEDTVATFECDATYPCNVRMEDFYADCAESCQKGDPATVVCEADEEEGYVYAASYVCSETIAHTYANFMDEGLICEDGQCTDGVGCNGTVIRGGNEGDLCMDANYIQSCTSNTEGWYCSYNEVTPFECDADEPCQIRKSDHVADCAAACNAGDPDKIVCVDFLGNYAVTLSCAETESGSNGYFASTYTECAGLCQDGVGCLPVESCDDNYVESCKDNKTYYCDEGQVTAESCDEGTTCQIRKSNSTANCATTCEQGTEPKSYCESFLGLMNYYVTESCEETAEGNYATFADYEWCDGDCDDATGCIPLEPCDETYSETCKENVAYYCEEGFVSNMACNEDNPCKLRKEDGYSDCAPSCTEDTPASITCITSNGTTYAKYSSCDETTDGDYALFSGYDPCSSTCTDGVGCDKG